MALNQAIAYLLAGGTPANLIDSAIRGVPEWRVVDAIETARDMDRGRVRSGGYVLDTLNAAFWSLLTTVSAEDAIARAVALGSDADTTGAVTGALAGAVYGEFNLPARWLTVLYDRDRIATLARKLVDWAAADA